MIEGCTGNYVFIIKSDITTVLYRTEYIPIFEPSAYSLRLNHPPNVPFVRTERSKSTSTPSPTLSWNQLDPNIQNSSSVDIFKGALLKFIRPKPTLIYKIHHPR